MRLSRAGLALLGFGLTIALASFAASIWTAVHEHHSESRITRIEGVIGLGQHRPVQPKRQLQANSKEVQSLDDGGGVGLTTISPENASGQPPAAHGHPAPQEHGHGTAPTPPQHDGGPTPTEPATAAPGGEPAAVEADQGTGSTGSSAGEAEAAKPNPITESVGGILEETGEAVNGVLCAATGSLQLQHNC